MQSAGERDTVHLLHVFRESISRTDTIILSGGALALYAQSDAMWDAVDKTEAVYNERAPVERRGGNCRAAAAADELFGRNIDSFGARRFIGREINDDHKT